MYAASLDLDMSISPITELFLLSHIFLGHVISADICDLIVDNCYLSMISVIELQP